MLHHKLNNLIRYGIADAGNEDIGFRFREPEFHFPADSIRNMAQVTYKWVYTLQPEPLCSDLARHASGFRRGGSFSFVLGGGKFTLMITDSPS